MHIENQIQIVCFIKKEKGDLSVQNICKRHSDFGPFGHNYITIAKQLVAFMYVRAIFIHCVVCGAI